MRYDQLVVAQNCDINKEQDEKKIKDIFKKHGFRKPKIVGTIKTKTGRVDFLFYINNKDIDKFAIWRLQYGLRWWEDVFFNHEEGEYPPSVLKKYPPRW